LKFSKEKNKKGWFKRLDYRDYSTTGHSALISSMFINRENVQKILGTSICALNDLGLGYYYYSDELRHHECTALIIQTLVENESYITSIIEECLRILGINNEMKNIKEYVAYIIEFLYPRIININEDNSLEKFVTFFFELFDPDFTRSNRKEIPLYITRIKKELQRI
jgi:hypothetical protein